MSIMASADPTREAMLAHLHAQYEAEEQESGSDAVRFDIEEAIYWFASDWHSGQWSNLYEALSTSPYRPGACRSGPERDDMYDSLETEFNCGEMAS